MKRDLTAEEASELVVIHDEIQALSKRRGTLSAVRRGQLLELHESNVSIPVLAEALSVHPSLVNKELARAREEREGNADATRSSVSG